MAGCHELVLAQLAEGPSYGYALHQTVIALNGSANRSSVYKALVKLEELGCVSATDDVEEVGGSNVERVRRRRSLADPQMFAITPAGLARLRTWMLSELPIDDKPHVELRQRLLYARPEDLPALLDVVRAALVRCAQNLAAARGPVPVRESAKAKAADLLAERGNAEFAETTLEWLRSAVVTLERLIREETSTP